MIASASQVILIILMPHVAFITYNKYKCDIIISV